VTGSYAAAAATLAHDKGSFDRARKALANSRSERQYPLLDNKIITAWNGMMIAACADAFRILEHKPYRRAAERAASFALENLATPTGALKRIYRADGTELDGYLEDYAYLADGLLALHTATGTQRWLDAASAVVDQMIERFWDAPHGGFYYSQAAADDLIVRVKEATDSALPSANAVATRCLTVLARKTGRQDLELMATRTLRAFGGAMTQQPAAYTSMIDAAWDYHTTLDRVVQGPQIQLPSIGTAAQSVLLDPMIKAVVTAVASMSKESVVAGGRFTALVDLRITPGWHINANPATEQWLIPTSLTVNSLDLPVELLEVDYPPASRLSVASMEDSLDVYQGTVRLSSALKMASAAVPGQHGIVRLIVQYQVCDDGGVCLQPAEWVGAVRLQVAGCRKRVRDDG
jgi:hypothetical protein